MQIKIKRIALALSLTVLMVVSIGCGNSKPSTAPTQSEQTAPAFTMDNKEIEHFNTYVLNIKGGSFIKQAEIKDNAATILFVKDYADYKTINPKSNVSEEDYKEYWSTGDRINQTLTIETARLFREFQGLNKISMVLPFQGKEYTLSVDRTAAEDFFKVNFADLKKLDKWEKWQNEFLAIYDNKEERAKFVKEFVQTR